MRTAARILFKGLVVVVPVGVTLYVLWWLGSAAEALLAPVLRWIMPSDGPLQYRTGMGLLLGTAVIFAIGLLTYMLLFRKFVGWLERLLERIPLVKSLYGGLRDLMDLMSRTQEVGALNDVVAVQLGQDLRLLGFITQPDSDAIPQPLTDDEDRVAVYLPMSYQIGGFTVFVKRAQLSKIDMSVEGAMRYALTAAMSTDTEEPLAASKEEGDEELSQEDTTGSTSDESDRGRTAQHGDQDS